MREWERFDLGPIGVVPHWTRHEHTDPQTFVLDSQPAGDGIDCTVKVFTCGGLSRFLDRGNHSGAAAFNVERLKEKASRFSRRGSVFPADEHHEVVALTCVEDTAGSIARCGRSGIAESEGSFAAFAGATHNRFFG